MPDNSIASAFIGAAGAIIGGIGGAIIERTRKDKRTRTTDKSLDKSVRDILFEHYGFHAATAYSISEILNLDGDSRVTRGWTGIKVNKGFTLGYVPGRFRVLTPGGSIRDGPLLTKVPQQFPKAVDLHPSRKTSTECEYRVEIDGGLTPDEPSLDYELQIDYSKSVLMKRDEADKAYSKDEFKHDYHLLDVEFPLDELTLQVSFPQNFAVSLFAGVFYGRTELRNDQEYQRVKNGFQIHDHGARFVVKQPILGFRYFISWIPKN